MSDFLDVYEDFIFVYKNNIDIPEDFCATVDRFSKESWSFVSFTTVKEGSQAQARSEMASLFSLTTEINNEYVNYLQGTIDPIAAASMAVVEDYAHNFFITTYHANLFTLLRITETEGNHFSVLLADNLCEGMATLTLSVSPEPAVARFPDFDLEVPLNQGDVLMAPGGFPFGHQLSGSSDGNLYLRRGIG